MSFWSTRRVLVAGGSGFIGSYLVEELIQAGANVTVVDDLSTGSLQNLEGVAGRFKFINHDLMELRSSIAIMAGHDTVMNLAARAHGLEYSSAHHGEMLFYNTTLALNILEAARLASVPHVFFTSSSCVYSDNAVTPTPELNVMTDLPESANEGYGWAKRIAELQASYYHSEYGMDITIVRPTNPYGARYRWSGSRAHVLPTLVKRVLDGDDPVTCWGSGRQRRNFIHASDVAKLMVLIAEKQRTALPVNIGYEEETTMAELLDVICKLAGLTPNVHFDTTKPEGKMTKSVDSARLQSLSDNYIPRISLKDGVAEMIQWYFTSFGREIDSPGRPL